MLRHDNGSQYVSHYFQREVAFLGIESSPSFVRAPEGNGVAERFIRTVQEQLLWVRYFDTVEQLRQAKLEFKDRYNRHWLLQRHGYRTPQQARSQNGLRNLREYHGRLSVYRWMRVDVIRRRKPGFFCLVHNLAERGSIQHRLSAAIPPCLSHRDVSKSFINSSIIASRVKWPPAIAHRSRASSHT